MAELNVVGVIVAKPEAEEAVRAALNSLVTPSLEEPGCISYALFESSEPSTFVTIEKWRSQEAIDEHMRSPHMQQALGAAAEALAAPPGLHILTPVS